MKKGKLVTWIIILGVILLSVFILTKPAPETDAELIKCIGENSVLYIQLGCHACETQEDMFGKNYEFLNVVDCWFERDECTEKQIKKTPTWIIDNQKHEGILDINKLKELTGC